MLKVLYVRTKGISQEKEFNDIDEILQAIGAKEEWETMEVGIEGVGIIANDQDLEDLPQNRLGIKGDFVLIGMKREKVKDGKFHNFQSLTNEKISQLRIGLAMQTYRDLSNNNK